MAEKPGIFVGLSTFDICYEIEHLPPRNHKARADSCWVSVGGPSLSAAITYAKLGGAAIIYTAASETGFGALLHETARDYGLEIVNCAANKSYTPIATIAVHPSNGDRTILSCNRDDVSFDQALPEPGEGAFLFWDGYYTDLFERIEADAPNGAAVVYDGGSWKENNRRLLHHVTQPIVSERFLESDEAKAWLDSFAGAQSGVIVTRGDRSVLHWSGPERREFSVPQVRACDTLGAGDVFHGAFCFARFREGLDQGSAIRFASAVAALSCTRRTPHWWTEREAIEFFELWDDPDHV